MISRPQKLVVALITYVPVLVVAVWGAIHFAGQIKQTLGHVGWILVGEMRQRLGRQIVVGKASAELPGKFVIEDVSISDGPSFAQGKLLSARRIVVHYDLREMIFGGKAAAGVKMVDVTQPRIWLVRHKDGTLSISDILKPPPGPKGQPFVGIVNVTGGTAIIRDYYVADGTAPVVTRLDHVDGRVDATYQPKYLVNAVARSGPGRFASMRVAADYDRTTQVIKADIDAKNLGLPFATKYVHIVDKLQVRQGTANVSIGVTTRLRDRRNFHHVIGMVVVKDASIQPKQLAEPITRTNGIFVLAGERVVAANITGTFSGSPVRMSGSLSNFKTPKLNVRIASSAVELPRLLRALRMRSLPGGTSVGTVRNLDTTVRGSFSKPDIEATAKIDSFSGSGYWGRDVQLSVDYTVDLVKLRYVRLNLMGAQAVALGTVQLTGSRSISLNGEIRGLDISRLPMPADYPMSGKLDADISVMGSMAKPIVSANASLNNGVWQGVKVGRAVVSMRSSKGGAKVLTVKASNIAGGSITASGVITPTYLDMNLTAYGIQLADVGRILKRPGVKGIVYARGRLSGKLDEPTFAGAVEVFKAQYFDHNFDYVRAKLMATKNGVKVSDGILRRYPSELVFSGAVSGVGKDSLSFRVKAHGERIRVERILALIGQKLDMSGTVAADLDASGSYLLHPQPSQFPFVDTVASGKAQLSDGTAFGYVVDAASAGFKFQRNILTLSNAAIDSENARLTLAGSVFADKKTVDLQFGLTGFNLARVREKLGDYALIGGIASASGTVTGPWNSITASANSSVDKLTLNNILFDQASLNAVYSGSTLDSAHLKLARRNQVYEVDVAGYDLATNSIESGTLALKNGNVPDMWDFLVASPYLKSERGASIMKSMQAIPRLTSGVLNGTGQISGSLKRPNGSVAFSAANVGLDSQKIDSMNLNASAKDGVITLDELKASSGEMYVEATGSPLYDNGKLQLQLSANNVDLLRMQPWLGVNTPNGMLNAEVFAEGDAKSPNVTASVEVVNPSYGGLTFDRIRVSRIEIRGDKIEFSESGSGIIASSGHHQIAAYGWLPWSWQEVTIPREKPIKLSAQLNNEDLSILSVLTPMIDSQGTKGSLEAVLDVTGSLSRLKMNGQILVADGQIALRGFRNQFTNVDVDVSLDTSFEGDQATNTVLFNKFSSGSSEGGNLNILDGRIVQEGGKPATVEALIVAKGFGISEKNAFGYGEDISTHIDAGLRVTDKLRAPLIADASKDDGKDVRLGVFVSDSTFKFAIQQAETMAVARKLTFDPRFEIDMYFGDNVVIEPPMMKVLVEGSGMLTGRLASNDPPLTLVLDIDVMKGSLMLASSRLRVIPGGKIDVRYVSPDIEFVSLKEFKAVTSVMATNALGGRDRYQITLNVAGRIPNLQIDMKSDPVGLSRQQMLAALGHVEGIIGGSEGALQTELANALTAVGSSTLFSPIEKVFVEQLGFEQFSLEYSPITPLTLYASTRLAGDLFVSYYQQMRPGVSATPNASGQSWILQFMYKIKNIYQVSFGIDDQQVTTLSAGVSKAF